MATVRPKNLTTVTSPTVGDKIILDGVTARSITIENFRAQSTAISPTYDTAAGTYTVTTETALLINKTVPAAHNIQLPTAASRNGIPIIIKDIAGNAAANIATILPNGSETIDGLSSVPINMDFGGFRLVPISTGGWFISP